MTRGTLVVTTAMTAFCAGVAVDSWLRVYGPPKPAVEASAPQILPDVAEARAATDRSAPQAPVALTKPRGTTGTSNHAGLRVPIDGADVEKFKGGFAEARTGHAHEAVDILAPRNTPIHAVDNGTVAKLFVSKAGGLTIYQFDADGRLCYYYAHLERYADGLHEGGAIEKGQVIGYVGTSGNAPKNTPHLHFAVFQLDERRHWWEGTALDPYRVFKDRG